MLGIDIIEIERIKSILAEDYGQRFLAKVYTAQELAYCRNGSAYRFSSLAARFAAKEAVAKALGTGIKDFSWLDIEVVNNPEGKPEINLSGQAKALAERQQVKAVHVSLSHTHTLAFASCYLEYHKVS
jgi:holo-[acyl-carrier protein] synthase